MCCKGQYRETERGRAMACYDCEIGRPHICIASGGVLIGSPSSGFAMDNPREMLPHRRSRSLVSDEDTGIPLLDKVELRLERYPGGGGGGNISLNPHLPARAIPRGGDEPDESEEEYGESLDA
jgi:hypothetical protein